MCVFKREPIRFTLLKYVFQTGTKLVRGVKDQEPIRHQPLYLIYILYFLKTLRVINFY